MYAILDINPLTLAKAPVVGERFPTIAAAIAFLGEAVAYWAADADGADAADVLTTGGAVYAIEPFPA